jgi:hypothetical protein
MRLIGVAYDGSPESRAAAELARDLAVVVGARLRVMRVLEPPAPGGAGVAYDRDWREKAEDVREHVQADLDGLLAELGSSARLRNQLPRSARHGLAGIRARPSRDARHHLQQDRAPGCLPRARPATRRRQGVGVSAQGAVADRAATA